MKQVVFWVAGIVGDVPVNSSKGCLIFYSYKVLVSAHSKRTRRWCVALYNIESFARQGRVVDLSDCIKHTRKQRLCPGVRPAFASATRSSAIFDSPHFTTH